MILFLKEDIVALTIHFRTKKEGYNIAAHWELAPEIAALRDYCAPETIILGNGDINTLEEAREKIKKSGMDGVMVGRGVLANPWLFSKQTPLIQERLKCMIKHAELFEKMYKTNCDKNNDSLKSFNTIKKYFKAYASGFDNAKDLRVLLMESKNSLEVKKIAEKFIKENI